MAEHCTLYDITNWTKEEDEKYNTRITTKIKLIIAYVDV